MTYLFLAFAVCVFTIIADQAVEISDKAVEIKDLQADNADLCNDLADQQAELERLKRPRMTRGAYLDCFSEN